MLGKRRIISSDRYCGRNLRHSSRPISCSRPIAADIGRPIAADVFDYRFDDIGNRLSSSVASVSQTYTANALNQYLTAGTKTLTHDADGNLTSDGSRNFTWTAENRLKKVEPVAPLTTGAKKVEFKYDYLGRRIQKTVSRWNGSAHTLASNEKFLYDDWTERGSAEMAQALLASAGPNGRAPLGRTFGNLVAVYNAASSNALLKTHTWGLDLSRSLQGVGGVGGLLGVKEQSGTHAGTYHFAYDANGNVTEVLKKNPGSLLAGSLAAHYEYDPFGNTIRSTGTYAAANPFRFSTKYWDPETTLYYYGFRHYDPATGRWPSRDPIGENWWTGEFNVYAFVRNDSLNWADLLGQTQWGRGPQSRGNCWRYAANDPAKYEEDHNVMPGDWKPKGGIYQDPEGKKNCKTLMEAVRSKGGSAPNGGKCPDCHDLITVQYNDGILSGGRISQDAHFSVNRGSCGGVGGGGGWSDKRGKSAPTSLPNSNPRPRYIKCGEWCLPQGTDAD